MCLLCINGSQGGETNQLEQKLLLLLIYLYIYLLVYFRHRTEKWWKAFGKYILEYGVCIVVLWLALISLLVLLVQSNLCVHYPYVYTILIWLHTLLGCKAPISQVNPTLIIMGDTLICPQFCQVSAFLVRGCWDGLAEWVEHLCPILGPHEFKPGRIKPMT